jgi:hypothetical protein
MVFLMDKKIFCVGDSRTGTMSMHRYLSALGISSVHNPVQEAKQTLPLHENVTGNWIQFKALIDEGKYQAFSDYPTRFFFKELLEQYEDAYFVLTKRRDLKTWQRSMSSFFAQFDMKLDIEDLSQTYEDVNAQILKICSQQRRHLLIIDIDGDSEINSAKIKSFLGVDSPLELGWENKSSVRRRELLSDRARLFDTQSKAPLHYVESICAPGKALLSEYGWTFLVNDTYQFLHYQFGLQSWASEDLDKSRTILAAREERLGESGIIYKTFAIPEKSVIYREHLPKILRELPLSEDRPAAVLAKANIPSFYYLEDFLVDAKSYGHLYFRGGSNPNWLGAYFIYLFVAEKIDYALGSRGLNRVSPLPLNALKPELAVCDGELSAQLNADFKSLLAEEWGFVQPPGGFENLVRFTLPESAMEAKHSEVHDDYRALHGNRATLVMNQDRQDLPRAVIFRDSTSDYLVDLLGQHFSRSVFVCGEGMVFEDVIEREKPDIVLHIVGERFLQAYPKTVAFARLFNHE